VRGDGRVGYIERYRNKMQRKWKNTGMWRLIKDEGSGEKYGVEPRIFGPPAPVDGGDEALFSRMPPLTRATAGGVHTPSR
jgi:hypothetical protein